MVDGQERELFMEPAEKQLTMAELAALFKQAQSVRRGAASAPVVYLQKQNDNLRTELPLLLPDNLHLPWVEEVRRSLPRPRQGLVLPPQALPCVCACVGAGHRAGRRQLLARRRALGQLAAQGAARSHTRQTPPCEQ